MPFKDGRLKNDPELVELRKKYEENFGPCTMPGWCWGIDNDFDEYKNKCRDKFEQMMKEKESSSS